MELFSKLRNAQNKKTIFLASFVLVLVGIGIIVGIVLTIPYRKNMEDEPDFRSKLGNFTTAAVVTDAPECARVGKDILMMNGTAVDSAIATLICMGVVLPQSCGIGGGFLMTIYERKTGKVRVLDARETAPSGAHKDMYENLPSNKSLGGLSVAIPGQLQGFEVARDVFPSSLDWATLFQPAIKIARGGFRVGKHLSNAIQKKEKYFDRSPQLKRLLINSSTGRVFKKGEIMKNPVLAKTLEKIALSGSSEDFYKGHIAKEIVDTIQNDGGIITLDDLSNYEARWLKQEIKIKVKKDPDLFFHSVPPPGGGVVLSLILNIMSGYHNITQVYRTDPVLFFHRLIEAFKFAFAQRRFLEDRDDPQMTQLLLKLTSESFGEDIRRKLKDSMTSHDPGFYDAGADYAEDHGTAQVSVLAPNGDAVSATTSINFYFGSHVVTEETGIVLNDHMHDFNAPSVADAFGVPTSQFNLIRPGRRPLSSMSPAVLIGGNGDVKMVIGASGGAIIPTSVASVILRTMWLGQDLRTAINAPRLHHRLYPNTTYEAGFPKEILEGLEKKGHILRAVPAGGAVIQGIVRGEDGRIYANSDYRKEGDVDGF